MTTGVFRALLGATTALVAIGHPQFVRAQEARYAFELQAQDLATALRAFASVTRQQLAFDGDVLRDKQSAPVVGSFTVDEALELLLKDTGLVARRASHGVIVIELPPKADVAPALLEQSAEPIDLVPAARDADELDPIVVTGSHIRGGVAAGANVQIYSREDMDRSGYATVHDFLATVPQNFTGGSGGQDPSRGFLGSSNLFGGSTVDLRGLGADSTLVLINGRRLAASGLKGDFTDLSTIPQSAIERIEILPDGASALYGSDAVGGVINIILRKDFHGAETRLRYGRATGTQLDEYRASQSFGLTWESGRVIGSYEFYKVDPLRYVERGFMETLDLRSRGGADYRSESSNPGNILDPDTFLPAFAIPRNQDGRSLTVADLLPNTTNLQDRSPSTYILPKQHRHSAYLTAEQEVITDLTLFGEVRFTKRKSKSVLDPVTTTSNVPSSNPFRIDPFNRPSTWVRFSFGEELLARSHSTVKSGAITGGARLNLSKWRWETTATYNKDQSRYKTDEIDQAALRAALADPNRNTSLNLFGHGPVNNPATLAKLLTQSQFRADSTTKTITSILDGPLFNINGRDISAAFGADFRRDKLDQRSRSLADTAAQDIYGAFAEISIPLVGPQDGYRFLRSLEVSVAGRYDKYEGVGSSTNPKIGVRMSPSDKITFNATYGTSYRAPNLAERATALNMTFITELPDPRSPTGFTQTLFLSGVDPDMTSEKSDTWTVGVTLKPSFVPGLTIQSNYFAIIFKDRISLPTPDMMSILRNESLNSGIITRNPSAQLITSLCNDPTFFGNPSNCIPSIVRAVVDYRLTNIAKTTARGFDFNINHSHQFDHFRLNSGITATYLLEHSYQQSTAAPSQERVDTTSNPVDLRGRGYVTLSAPGLTGSVMLNYTDSYKNDLSTLQDKIKSYTTIDLNLGVRFDSRFKVRDNAPFAVDLNIVNLLANDPPFADLPQGYDGAHADPLGRLISIELRANW